MTDDAQPSPVAQRLSRALGWMLGLAALLTVAVDLFPNSWGQDQLFGVRPPCLDSGTCRPWMLHVPPLLGLLAVLAWFATAVCFVAGAPHTEARRRVPAVAWLVAAVVGAVLPLAGIGVVMLAFAITGVGALATLAAFVVLTGLLLCWLTRGVARPVTHRTLVLVGVPLLGGAAAAIGAGLGLQLQAPLRGSALAQPLGRVVAALLPAVVVVFVVWAARRAGGAPQGDALSAR